MTGADLSRRCRTLGQLGMNGTSETKMMANLKNTVPADKKPRRKQTEQNSIAGRWGDRGSVRPIPFSSATRDAP
jgi:hypothetical protein